MPWMLLLKPTVILGLLLAVSVAGNVALWKMRDAALRQIGALSSEVGHAKGAAKRCSEGVANLRKAAEARAALVAVTTLRANELALAAEKRVDATLQERPSVPGDNCASALDLSKRKMHERQKK